MLSGAAGQRGSRAAKAHRRRGFNWSKLPHCPAAPLPHLRNSEKLMRLQAEPPARMLQAVLKGGRGIGLPLGPVHRLEKEVTEFESLELGGIGTCLREDQ